MYKYWRGCSWGFGRAEEDRQNLSVVSVVDEGGEEGSLDIPKLSFRRTVPHSDSHLSLVCFKWVLPLLIQGSVPASIIHHGRCVQEQEGVDEKQ